jgi:hypothetical protein
MTNDRDSQSQGLDRAKAPIGYLTTTDLLTRMFLLEVGLSDSALGSDQQRWLLEEVERGRADLRRRAISTLYYVERDGEMIAPLYDSPDKEERAREARQRQLAEIWCSVRQLLWQAFLDGSLRAKRVEGDGRLADIPTAHFKLNVEAEVFDLGEMILPTRGMLVVAERAFKRWLRSSPKRGATSLPTGAPDALNSPTATNDIVAGEEHQPISRAKRRPGPRPGTVRRWAEKDRALYPDIEALLAKGRSLTGATLELATQDKVAGTGSKESRASRLYKQYKEDAQLDPTRSH